MYQKKNCLAVKSEKVMQMWSILYCLTKVTDKERFLLISRGNSSKKKDQ